ncbi:MAG: DNRLRE domain-containing protein [Balneolales bacterium]
MEQNNPGQSDTVQLNEGQVEILSGRDNTLYESNAGSLSNGAGEHLFAGRTSQASNYRRRALLWFDVASAIPEGAEITHVTLQMNVSRAPMTTPEIFYLHRVTADWGEGASHAGGEEGSGGEAESGDATWIHRFHDDLLWATPGGDYESEPSGEAIIEGLGSYSWEATDTMNQDVQSWLDEPDDNSGWVVIGNEEVSQTSKRFDSRHHPTENNRPRLIVDYQIPTSSEEIITDVPSSFRLFQNFPNPFNPVTQIRYRLDSNGPVRLVIYNVLGMEVQVLVDEVQSAGEHLAVWDTGTSGNINLSSGVYFYRLYHGSRSETRQMLLVK